MSWYVSREVGAWKEWGSYSSVNWKNQGDSQWAQVGRDAQKDGWTLGEAWGSVVQNEGWHDNRDSNACAESASSETTTAYGANTIAKYPKQPGELVRHAEAETSALTGEFDSVLPQLSNKHFLMTLAEVLWQCRSRGIDQEVAALTMAMSNIDNLADFRARVIALGEHIRIPDANSLPNPKLIAISELSEPKAVPSSSEACQNEQKNYSIATELDTQRWLSAGPHGEGPVREGHYYHTHSKWEHEKMLSILQLLHERLPSDRPQWTGGKATLEKGVKFAKNHATKIAKMLRDHEGVDHDKQLFEPAKVEEVLTKWMQQKNANKNWGVNLMTNDDIQVIAKDVTRVFEWQQ